MKAQVKKNEASKKNPFREVINKITNLTELRKMGGQCAEPTTAHSGGEWDGRKRSSLWENELYRENWLGKTFLSSTISSEQMGSFVHIILRSVVCFYYIPLS